MWPDDLMVYLGDRADLSPINYEVIFKKQLGEDV